MGRWYIGDFKKVFLHQKWTSPINYNYIFGVETTNHYVFYLVNFTSYSMAESCWAVSNLYPTFDGQIFFFSCFCSPCLQIKLHKLHYYTELYIVKPLFLIGLAARPRSTSKIWGLHHPSAASRDQAAQRTRLMDLREEPSDPENPQKNIWY